MEETRAALGLLATLRHFVLSTRAGATAIPAAAVTIMTVGGAALIVDHVWLVDQRDTLKTASDAPGVAATLEMGRILNRQPTIGDDALKAALEPVARPYVELNLGHLSNDRYAQAISALVVEIVPHRAQRTVDVAAQADMGGALLSRHLPMFGSSDAPQQVRVATRVESVTNPIEVVLAIDISTSMWQLLNGLESCTDSDVSRGCRTGGREDSRISLVKSAAKDLVGILGPSEEDRVAFGVVPWHTQVRLAPDALTDWDRKGWADYPTRRVYGEPYICSGSNCTPPASVEQALAPTAPETWKGCLDSHRMGSVGTRAAVPAISEFFKTPSESAFAQAFFPAVPGAAYECQTHPFPAGFNRSICYHGRKYYRHNRKDFDPDAAQRGCSDDNPTILPLSTDAESIGKAIDALAPIGIRPYSALGLLWGQRLLDHSWKDVWGGAVHPVDPAARDSEGLRKAIVLLTDGETAASATNPAPTAGSDTRAPTPAPGSRRQGPRYSSSRPCIPTRSRMHSASPCVCAPASPPSRTSPTPSSTTRPKRSSRRRSPILQTSCAWCGVSIDRRSGIHAAMCSHAGTASRKRTEGRSTRCLKTQR